MNDHPQAGGEKKRRSISRGHCTTSNAAAFQGTARSPGPATRYLALELPQLVATQPVTLVQLDGTSDRGDVQAEVVRLKGSLLRVREDLRGEQGNQPPSQSESHTDTK